MQLIPRPTDPKTSLRVYDNCPVVAGNPIEDLMTARRLCQDQINKGNIVNGVMFAIAAAKGIQGAARWGIDHHEILLQPAVMRLAQKLIGIVGDEIKDPTVIDAIVADISKALEP